MVASLLQVQRQSTKDERHWQLEWNLDFERAVLSALRVCVRRTCSVGWRQFVLKLPTILIHKHCRLQCKLTSYIYPVVTPIVRCPLFDTNYRTSLPPPSFGLGLGFGIGRNPSLREGVSAHGKGPRVLVCTCRSARVQPEHCQCHVPYCNSQHRGPWTRCGMCCMPEARECPEA